jgi:Zn-dependent protease
VVVLTFPPIARMLAAVMPTHDGALRLFRLAGIDVFLHWSWFVVALLEVQVRSREYGSPLWNAAEYLALFGIVLMHEFGHAFACRQVGGRAERIVLWPLGGVAYVDPPQRPGATLWSIAAGPLVNVALVPVLIGLVLLGRSFGWAETAPDAMALVRTVAVINAVLLAFNLLPVYPLDGGQILRSVLWFGIGRARSLMAATLLGFFGVAALALWALRARSVWIGIMAAFVGLNCWRGFRHAKALSALAKLPRRPGLVCPSCGAGALLGAFWACGACGESFDTFETGAQCPSCHTRYGTTRCADCGRESSIEEWRAPVPLRPA